MELDYVKNAGSNETSKEIGDLNLAYMLLAQRLVKQDRAAAMFRLGISRELADMLGTMSLAQVLKLSASNFLLCSFRMDDHPSMAAVVSEGKDTSLQLAHMSILASAQRPQTRAVGIAA
ncbi:MAG: flagellar transcriptional regulator FlhD [Variovorax sp.]